MLAKKRSGKIKRPQKKKDLIKTKDSPYSLHERLTVTGNPSHVEFKPSTSPLDQRHVLITSDQEVTYLAGSRKVVYNRHTGRKPACATFRPVDGQLIAVGGGEGVLRIFRAPSTASTATLGEQSNAANNHQVPLREIKTHKEPVQAVAWANKHLVFTGSDDKHIALWDITTSALLFKVLAHDDVIRTNAVSSSNGFAATGSYDHKVKLWNIQSYLAIAATTRAETAEATNEKFVECLLELNHGAPVEAVCFTPKRKAGKTMLYSCGGTVIREWDTETGICTRSITDAFAKTITAICMSGNGKQLYAAGLDGVVKSFSLATFAQKHVIGGLSTAQSETPIIALAVAARKEAIIALVAGSRKENVLEITRKSKMISAQTATTQENFKYFINSHLVDEVSRTKQRMAQGRYRQEALLPFEDMLATFKYAAALDSALVRYMGSPIMVISLLEHIRSESGLFSALAGRDEVSLMPLLKFIYLYIRDPRFSVALIELAGNILDLYGSVVGHSQHVDVLLRAIQKQLAEELELQQHLHALKGMLDTLLTVVSLPSPSSSAAASN